MLGLSGLRNAYRSVRSADGSSAISGASRWLDAAPFPGPSIVAPTAAAAASRPTAARDGDPSVHLNSFLHVAVGNGSCSPCEVERFAPNRNARADEARVVEAVASIVLALPGSQDRFAMRRHHAHLSDEALVALVARGDEDALAELYDRIGRIAYGLALRVLRDERHAEDAVQEAFLQVWRSAATFRAERAKASTWVLTLVHRRAVDLVRREERRQAEPLGEEAAGAVATERTEEAAWLRFERERIQSALKQLPDVQREALELAYYGGFSQSELAERLGVPLGTIKSRMFAGLARLRELLDDATQEGSWKPEFTS